MTVRFRLEVVELDRDEPWDLDEAGLHYLTRVHRLKPGDLVTIFDGHGRERNAQLTLTDGAFQLVPHGPVKPGLLGSPVTVVYGVPKGDKLDRVARQLTELGVGRLILVACDRSVVKLTPQRAGKRLDRLRRVIDEAARQSGRSDVMSVDGPYTMSEALTQLSDHRLLVFDPSGQKDHEAIVPSQATAVVVGPEGGLSQAELAVCDDAGGHRVGLGDLILRTETAAPVAAALTLHRMRLI